MANVTVKIPDYKGGVGTLQWLEQQLAAAKITKGNTKAGNPGLWIQLPNSDKVFLCIVMAKEDDSREKTFGYQGYTVKIPHAVAQDWDAWTGLFTFLTDAARVKCTEFIKETAKAFVDGLDGI